MSNKVVAMLSAAEEAAVRYLRATPLNGHDIQPRIAPLQAANDVIVEVLVGGELEHGS
jgi:hypothetical protein